MTNEKQKTYGQGGELPPPDLLHCTKPVKQQVMEVLTNPEVLQALRAVLTSDVKIQHVRAPREPSVFWAGIKAYAGAFLHRRQEVAAQASYTWEYHAWYIAHWVAAGYCALQISGAEVHPRDLIMGALHALTIMMTG